MRESRRHEPNGTCLICGASFPQRKLHDFGAVRPSISELIAEGHADWTEGAQICQPDLDIYRKRYVERMLEDERGELGLLEKRVVESLGTGGIVSQPLHLLADGRASLGERLADRVAAVGGSWGFILSFVAILIVWMLLNVTGWLFQPFDRFPFILLNLVLSCLAALQAPVIMMSQRRQEQKDRLRAENDYQVNLKAELEIRQLHEKMDHQLARQWERLTELQQIQIDLLEDRSRRS